MQVNFYHFNLNIYETAPLTCGHPDRRVNSTVVGKSFSMGATVEYRCPTGSVTLGATTRSCQTNGLWSDDSPTCKRKALLLLLLLLTFLANRTKSHNHPLS
jgi:hypothetical protein